MKVAKDFVKETLTQSMGLAKEMALLSKGLEKRRKTCQVNDHRINLYGKRTNLVGHAIRGAIQLGEC